MEETSLPARSAPDRTPLAAFAALVLLPVALLALLGGFGTPRAEKPRGNAPAALPEVPDLPAAADDTVVLSELAAGDAQARNAAVGFASVGPGRALPFSFRGSSADRTRARDCLALAGMAEAGGGEADQRAVMQVILNRVRHPAFAGTVCGVVFEGSQRPTGCQFSFTCDGSLARRYSDAAWRTARARADAMLDGATEASVGNATHFHADYVYPWWSDELDKVAKVGPHIFFRWRGFWGSRTALSARYGGGEPDPLRLREGALATATSNPLPTLLESGESVRSITAPSTSLPPGQGATAAETASPGPGAHFVIVAQTDAVGELVSRARALCPGVRYCQVYGWDNRSDIPSQLPLSQSARAELRFSYLAPRSGNQEVVFVDCSFFTPSQSEARCLPRRR